MPLQIRRGTDIQRQAITPAAGELIFVENTNQLYVGNGSTPGGILATGYTNNDAQDAAAVIFTANNPAHSNINFAYNTSTNLITAAVDLSNYTGTIRADAFKGSLFADDGSTVGGTELVNAVDGSINLDGTVKGHIVPDVALAYDLGSAASRFRDLYLSGSSIELGAATITATGSVVNLPAGSTVGGVAIGTGAGSGSGGGIDDYSGNIIGDDSSIIVNTSTNTVSGIFVGDLTGSVFGDNSTIIIDAVNNIVRVAEILSNSGSLVVGAPTDPTTLTVIADQDNICILRGITDGSTAPNLVLESSRGNSQFPSTLLADDEIAFISMKSYDGSLYKSTLAIVNKLTATANMADDNPESELLLAVSSGASNFSIFTFLGNGTFVAPGAVQLAVFADDAARSAAISTPVVGMMVFMASGTAPTVTNKTVVYDGTAWVSLH